MYNGGMVTADRSAYERPAPRRIQARPTRTVALADCVIPGHTRGGGRGKGQLRTVLRAVAGQGRCSPWQLQTSAVAGAEAGAGSGVFGGGRDAWAPEHWASATTQWTGPSSPAALPGAALLSCVPTWKSHRSQAYPYIGPTYVDSTVAGRK